MRWFRELTSRQRTILVALALSVIAVVSLLAWNVWSTLRTPPAANVLAPAGTSESSEPSTPTPTPSLVPTPTIIPSPTPTPPFDVSRAGVVAGDVAAARQSRTRWGTPLTLVSKSDMARAIYRHHNNRPPLVTQARRVLEPLRLWFWDSLRLDVLAQADDTAAFYAPEAEELVLRRDWEGAMDKLEIQLAYGYARALPDQYGDLLTLTEEASTLDQTLALMAVADGDALVSTLLYRGIEPGSPAGDALQAEIMRANCPRWQIEDALLDDLTCLAFRLGSDFAIAQYQVEGTQALDEMILRPPRSTEQLLDHQQYVAFAQPLPLSPLVPELGTEWTLTTTETLGQALLDIVLSEWLQESDEAVDATGWGGDLLQVWEGPDEGSLAVWQIAWDGVGDAVRFYAAMMAALPEPLLPGTVRDTTAPAGIPRGRWWAGMRGGVFLYRRVNTVWLVWGSDPDLVQTAAGAIAADAVAADTVAVAAEP